MSGILLRVFSGVHAGAEISLQIGSHVIGTSDVCDIILADSSLAKKHAVLEISKQVDIVSFQVRPLDGSVVFQDDELSEITEIPQAVPFALGGVLFAWVAEDAENFQTLWAEVNHSISNVQVQKRAPAAETEDAGQQSPDEENVAEDEAEKASNVSDSSGLTLPQQPEQAKKRHWPKIAALLLAVGLATTLCISITGEENLKSKEQEVRELLKESGYAKLDVVPKANGVAIRGRVATDRERGRILQLAQMLSFPVYLEVDVRSDVAEAIKSSYNSMGLYPEVTEMPLSEYPAVKVSGYIKDGVLEEQAFSKALLNVPALRKNKDGKASLSVISEIRYQRDVEPVLLLALQKSGLKNIKAEFNAGNIVLRGTLTSDARKALYDVLEQTAEKLKIKLPYEVVNDANVHESASVSGNKQPVRAAYNDTSPLVVMQENQGNEQGQGANAVSSSFVPEFKVTSVSPKGVMKFILLESGERVFLGGEVPGGFILEEIALDHLRLRKGEILTDYPLGGSQ